MNWEIEVSQTAKKELKKVDKQVYSRIIDFLENRLAPLDNPRSIGEALHGRMSDYWKYRVGDYRIVCQIIDSRLRVLVVDLGHRSEVYR